MPVKQMLCRRRSRGARRENRIELARTSGRRAKKYCRETRRFRVFSYSVGLEWNLVK